MPTKNGRSRRYQNSSK